MPSRSIPLLAAALLSATAILGAGCTTPLRPVHESVPGERTELDRGYATLASLLDDERQVHKILAIKSEGLPIRLLTQDIAATSAKAADELKVLSALDPAINLEQSPDLPMIEAATRDSITIETTLDLVFSVDTFETRLLLSQGQALRYGRFLAVRLKQADPNTERRKWLDDFAGECERLYVQVVEALHAPSVQE